MLALDQTRATLATEPSEKNRPNLCTSSPQLPASPVVFLVGGEPRHHKVYRATPYALRCQLGRFLGKRAIKNDVCVGKLLGQRHFQVFGMVLRSLVGLYRSMVSFWPPGSPGLHTNDKRSCSILRVHHSITWPFRVRPSPLH